MGDAMRRFMMEALRTGHFTFAMALAACLATPAAADNYYAGKTLTIVVGYAPAGGYASYATLIAKHIGRYIPGNPAVIVKHVPGAGSVVAANQVYNLGKADGLTLASINMFNLYSTAMTGGSSVKYDLTKFQYIGNARSGNSVLLGRNDSYPTLDALRAAKKPIILGVGAKGDGHHLFGYNMQSGFGIPFSFIAGYGGGGEIDLALERKEIDVRVANLNSYLVSKPTWMESGFVRPLVQSGVPDGKGGVKRDPRMPKVPTVIELFPDNRSIKELESFASLGDLLALVYVAPPDTPPELVKVQREAFMGTLSDATFLKEAEGFNLEITPMSGPEVEATVRNALGISAEVINLIKTLKEAP
jgi:tripartite-type tricarboxylate transporter receptor subunit TctC